MKYEGTLNRHRDIFGTWYFYTSTCGNHFYIYKTGDGYWMTNKITEKSTCTGKPFLRYKGKLYDLLANLSAVGEEPLMDLSDMYPTKMFI